MTLLQINWTPTDRQLRQFSIICLFAFPLLGWIWGGGATALILLTTAGAMLAIAGIFIPPFVRPIFVGLMIVTAPIGMAVGELAMLTIFFTVFLPLGLMFRLAKRDALQLRPSLPTESYFQPKKRPHNTANYYRQS